MTIAALQGTLLMYTMEKSNLTQKLMGIMDNVNIAMVNSTDLMEQTNEKRAYYSDKAQTDAVYADSTQYQIDSSAVEDDYELQLSKINSWDSQLQQEKSSIETELKIITTYEESWTTLLKGNIKKDFTFGSSSGS